MKENLVSKQESLAKSLNKLMQDKAAMEEQITMHRGALQFTQMLLKEIEDEEAKAAEAKAESPVKAVPAAAE